MHDLGYWNIHWSINLIVTSYPRLEEDHLETATRARRATGTELRGATLAFGVRLLLAPYRAGAHRAAPPHGHAERVMRCLLALDCAMHMRVRACSAMLALACAITRSDTRHAETASPIASQRKLTFLDPMKFDWLAFCSCDLVCTGCVNWIA